MTDAPSVRYVIRTKPSTAEGATEPLVVRCDAVIDDEVAR